MPTSRASGFASQHLVSLIGVYFAAGWGLLEFVDWISFRYGLPSRATTVVLAAWLLGLPLLFLVALRRARAASPSPASVSASAQIAAGAPPAARAAAAAGGASDRVPGGQPSVAVLPLVSLSAAPEDVYLSGGINVRACAGSLRRGGAAVRRGAGRPRRLPGGVLRGAVPRGAAR